MTNLVKIEALPAEIGKLVALSQAEGFNFVRRLEEDFISGGNRFDRSGEALFEVRRNGTLIAIGGLNIDPYTAGNSTARVRRLYVHPNFRGRGIGKILMRAIEGHAAKSFFAIHLFTDNESASRFYESLGYHRRSDTAKISHVKYFGTP